MTLITYGADVQRQAQLALYAMHRAALNRRSDEEGCGAVLVALFPPATGCGE